MPFSLCCVMSSRNTTLELIWKDIVFVKDKRDSLFQTSQQDSMPSLHSLVLTEDNPWVRNKDLLYSQEQWKPGHQHFLCQFPKSLGSEVALT